MTKTCNKCKQDKIEVYQGKRWRMCKDCMGQIKSLDKGKRLARFKRYYHGHPFKRLVKLLKKNSKTDCLVSAKDLWNIAKKQKL